MSSRNVVLFFLTSMSVLSGFVSAGSPTASDGTTRTPELTVEQTITRQQLPDNGTPVRKVLSELEGVRQLRRISSRLVPVAFASGDFDEDGVPDLVAGYSAGSDALVTLYRGNIDSIYPNTKEALQRRKRGEWIDAPFLPPTESLPLPAAVDFLGTGDFDNDGHLDVVSGTRGGNQLHFTLGDGKGRLAKTARLTLPGNTTELITGEMNRPDGIADLVVGIETKQGAFVLVFESPDGVLQAKPERYPVPFPVDALALDQLTSQFKDLVIASGNHLVIVHGRDRKLSFDQSRQRRVNPATVEDRSFASNIESLAVGDFSGQQQRELALLLDDGSIHTLSHATQNAQSPAPISLLISPGHELGFRGWLSREVSSPPSTHRHSKRTFLVNGGRSLLSSDSLVVAEKGSGQMFLLDLAEHGAVSGIFESFASIRSPTPRSASLELNGELSDVMPMRLNGDALSDLVILKSGEHPLSILTTQAESVFTVTNTNDSGVGSLRQAILDANSNPGLDSISFNIPGGGVQTVVPLSPFADITGSLTIDGTTQPGYVGIPLIEIAGYEAGDANGLTLVAGNCTVRGLTINRFFQLAGVNRGYQIRVEISSSHNVIEGNLLNTDNLGTSASPNPFTFLHSGIFLQNSPDNIIGGTTAAAKNVISGNRSMAIEMNGIGTQRTLIQGNFIGTDITGTVAIGNGFRGISVSSGPNNTIGGTSPGAGNVISKNAPFGIIVDSDNNIIQGNFIGTDVTGTVAMPNSLTGIALGTIVNNTVGGTSPNARNVISGHSHDGIEINAAGRRGFQIQGNYIGTDATGTIALGNRENGINIGNTEDSLISGNLISGNVGFGIQLFGIGIPASRGTQIRNNRIGTDASGNAPLGNIGLGIYVDGTGGVLIGGLDGTGANTIAFNTRGGVYVALAWEDAIRQNSIFSNGGLGIDLAPLGCYYLLGCYGNVTPNDACDTDSGGDLLQNFPVVSAAGSSVLGTRIQGTLNSTANSTFVLDFFSNDACDPSGYGEGQTFIGSTTVTTDNICVASFNVLLPTVVPAGKTVTSTATHPSGNTSEFSQCVGVIGLPPPPTVQFSSSSFIVNEGLPRVDIALTRSGDTTSNFSVSFATNDGAGLTNCNVFNGIASPRCDYIGALGTISFAPGETSKTFSIAIVDDSYAEGNESFTIGLNSPAGATLGLQSTATVTINENDATNGPNPIDNTNFFVRQQYLDFLGREPDPPGFAGWVNTINNCTGDTTQCDRIHVSQLFFQSLEFQERGYFVYRFYPVAFGRKPDYDEFVPALASVSGFLDNNQLESAKIAFIATFMSQPLFANTYDPLNNTQYVDTLLNTAGVMLSSRQSMIDGLNNSTLTRGKVLRQIVESPEVSTKYSHQAYAVMEYFGYLRRQPDAFYLDWIQVLDQTNDPRGMVTGFVNSAEYRQRFGP